MEYLGLGLAMAGWVKRKEMHAGVLMPKLPVPSRANANPTVNYLGKLSGNGLISGSCLMADGILLLGIEWHTREQRSYTIPIHTIA